MDIFSIKALGLLGPMSVRAIHLKEVKMNRNMFRLLLITLLGVISISCGGSSGSATATGPTTATACVLDTSKIGDCTL